MVFIIFEVEVALFFPPAVVFGKATRLMTPQPQAVADPLCDELGMILKNERKEDFGKADMLVAPTAEDLPGDARRLALAAMLDLGAFFVVILLGFAYVWWRGDLDWVRAIGSPRLKIQESEPLPPFKIIA